MIGATILLKNRAEVQKFVLTLASNSTAAIEQQVQEREGVFNNLIPGFCLLKGCQHDNIRHCEGNALIHTAKVFAETARLTSRMPEDDRFLLLLVALVHDIEKPATRAEKDGKVTFYGHAEKAAERSAEFGKIFQLSAPETEKLDFLVRHHMSAHLMKGRGEAGRIELYKSPHFPSLELFQEADARSSWQSADGKKHAEVLRSYFDTDRPNLLKKEEATNLEKALYASVVDVLKKLGVKPGPYFGKVRQALQSAVLSEGLKTEEDATTWARKYHSEHTPT